MQEESEVERERISRALAAACAALAVASSAAAAHDEHAASDSRYERSVVRVDVPDVVLLDSAGQPVWTEELLRGEGPWLVNFVYTSCSTVCPVMTSTFASARRKLADAGQPVRLVSISIDPEHDTPERLARYASAHGGDASWRFLTGSQQAVRRMQAAFGAYRGDKASHAPLAFLRAKDGARWLRLEGFPSAEALARELRGLACAAPGERPDAATAVAGPPPARR
ncbi:MAG: SCO family protein [Proteobacteria bacterium]|nr:MAG: SCO family protein [Pseudomonadota bacterium]